MFTVDKATLPRHWCAYTGNVREELGASCNNEGDFNDETAAIAYAKQALQERLKQDYDRVNCYSRFVLTVYAFRALWNSKLKAALARHYKKVSEARKNMLNPPLVKIDYLPANIPVLGNRLDIGTKIFCIDSYSLTFEEMTVIEENIAYYRHKAEGHTASYRVGPSTYVKSDLSSGYSNKEYYIDKEIATARIKTLLQGKIETLGNRLKDL